MTDEKISRASVARGLRRAIAEHDLPSVILLLSDLPGLAGSHHLEALSEAVDAIHHLDAAITRLAVALELPAEDQ